MTRLYPWAIQHPWPTAVAAALVALVAIGVVWVVGRALARLPHAVTIAAVGAMVCTAYSADTSWNFAGHRLGMTSTTERTIMFAAAEIALLACAVMARANKAATATKTEAGTTGVPGVLVWVITGVQVIPAYSESGFIGGTVRAIIGPVMAGLLWHLAMGLEIRVVRPGALSTGLPALIARELRERLLSRLGLAVRDRSAEQITRDRAMHQAVRLASRTRLRGWGRARLAKAVAGSGAATNGAQRHRLMRELAARRTSLELATVPVPSPWATDAVPEGYPSTPLGVTGAQLRAMNPVDAIRQVHAAHPTLDMAALASLCIEYGVPTTESLASRALGRIDGSTPILTTSTRPVLAAVPDPVPEVRTPDLLLDLAPMPEVHPDVAAPVPVHAAGVRRTSVHARVPDRPAADAPKHPTLDDIQPPAAEGRAQAEPDRTRPESGVPDPVVSAVTDPSTEGTDADAVLARARELDAAYLKAHKRHVPIHVLKSELHVGQPAAQRLQRELKGEQK
ncbi:hypothetical protein [Streptomyces chryseus]